MKHQKGPQKLQRLLFLSLSAFLILGFIFSITQTNAAAATEMKVYGILLKDNSTGKPFNHGDAVLLKSQGRNLLMDVGGAGSSKSLIKFLKDHSIKKLDVYISHMHEDHIGGMKALLNDKYFTIGKVYLPYNYGRTSSAVRKDYTNLVSLIKGKNKTIVSLKTGSTFSVGDAKIRILGAIGKYDYRDMLIWQFRNNNSLCAMVTCDKIKFLSCGDIHKIEEAALIKKYGSQLKCHILKASHHGLADSSSNAWMNATKPKYTFAINNVVDQTAKARITKVSSYRVTGTCKKTLLYTIKNNVITKNY